MKNGVVSGLSLWAFRDCDEFVQQVMGRFVIKRIWSTAQLSWQVKVPNAVTIIVFLTKTEESERGVLQRERERERLRTPEEIEATEIEKIQ